MVRTSHIWVTAISSLCLFLSCQADGLPQEQEAVKTPETKPRTNSAPRYDWESAELIWSDEFDGEVLDPEKWLFETGAHGWGNNEWQDYVTDGVTEVSDGTLKISALKTGSGGHVADYQSARLNSKASFRYGKIEIRAMIPEHRGNGLWPALWMLGDNIGSVGWPMCGEIDLMEYVSFEPDRVHFSIHSGANNHKNGTQITSGPVSVPDVEESFHVYGLLWTPDYLKFYLDEPSNVQLTFSRPSPTSAENWPFSKPFYFLMNIAVGGDWGGLQGVDDSIFPAIMEVDYIRVFELPKAE